MPVADFHNKKKNRANFKLVYATMIILVYKRSYDIKRLKQALSGTYWKKSIVWYMKLSDKMYLDTKYVKGTLNYEKCIINL